jgi:hypothetical protein
LVLEISYISKNYCRNSLVINQFLTIFMKRNYLSSIITIISCLSLGRAEGQNCVLITEPPPVSAGTPTNATVCHAVTGRAIITLNNNITNEDSGGTWTLAPASPNPAGAFNAMAGTFNPNGVALGAYIFRYSVGTATCGDSKDITILIDACCPPKLFLPLTLQRL